MGTLASVGRLAIIFSGQIALMVFMAQAIKKYSQGQVAWSMQEKTRTVHPFPSASICLNATKKPANNMVTKAYHSMVVKDETGTER